MGPILRNELINIDDFYTLDVQLYSNDESLRDIHKRFLYLKIF